MVMVRSIRHTIGVAFLFLVCAHFLSAQDIAEKKKDPPPFIDFSPKFGKPPAKGEVGRIDIQIAPIVNQPQPSQALPQKNAVPAGAQDWFWDKISPLERAGKAASDFDEALSHISASAQGQPFLPRLNDMKTLLTLYQGPILGASVQHSISPPLIAAVVYVESGGDPNAVSR